MNVYWTYPQSYPQNMWIIKILHIKEGNIIQTESRFYKFGYLQSSKRKKKYSCFVKYYCNRNIAKTNWQASGENLHLSW